MAKIVSLAVEAAGFDVLAKGGAEAWQAVEEHGIKALDNYDVEGLQGPVSYTEGDNRLSKSLRYSRCRMAKSKRLPIGLNLLLSKYEKFRLVRK